jgi:gliding motility-associated-like protein
VDSAGLYISQYIDTNLCDRVDSIFVRVLDETDYIFIPNTFTPNEDGLNDTWQIVSGSENIIYIQVFDRWGDLIWETKDIEEPWDGTTNGVQAEVGVYAYRVFYYSSCYQKNLTQTGSVLLLR